LQAPIWERQPNETELEHVAFVAWLCQGRELRDWVNATNATGLDPAAVRALSVRWVWEVRAAEWLRHSRAVATEQAEKIKPAVEALQQTRLGYARSLAELVMVEAGKLLLSSRGTPANVLDARELARIATVAESVLEALRRQAEGLPAEMGATSLDWGRLTPAELEQARKLRAKAEGRVA
jgi:hypothetical protein